MALSLPGSNYRAVDLHSVESPDTGATLVVSFSIGLALTLVTVGVAQQSAFSRSQNAGADLTLSQTRPLFFQSVDWLSWCVYGRHGFMGIMR